ncbi:MAG: hypothetical protein OK455_09945, partial [Thaumarchaeota archaeon]|nr:hypothetical protein [Nitrososphaerota archaeon]
RLRVKHVSIGQTYPEGAQDKVLGAVRASLSSPNRPGDFEAIVDVGGEGVEPSLYLFAEDAVKVAERALQIAKEYSRSV